MAGVEALSRGIDLNSGALIPPARLFADAQKAGIPAETHNCCRDTALRTFAEWGPDGVLLFLNFDVAEFQAGNESSVLDVARELSGVVRRNGLAPERVAIEVLESRTELDRLRRIVDSLRRAGFLIVLDDVGYGHSNLDRIPSIRPDIIKIDRALVREINSDYHKQETFMALANLSRRIGALVVAEGVETEAEAMLTMELGADLIQGYYLARPNTVSELLVSGAAERAAELAIRFKSRMVERIGARRLEHRRYTILINEVLCKLAAVGEADYNKTLSELSSTVSGVECFYVLDENGVQVTDTIFTYDIPAPHGLFHPAPKGTDHSLKEYYYVLLDIELQKYTTGPYVSLASGNVCRTISACFRDAENRVHILCIDVLAPADSLTKRNRLAD